MSGFGSFGGARPSGFGTFGSSQNTSPFGQQNATPAPAFGQPASNAFGQTQQTPAFGGFGQPPSTPAPAFGGSGAFGAQSTPAFGQPAQTPAFGQPQQSTSSFGGFGASSGGGAFSFGSQANKPFGAPAAPAGGGMFGGGNAFGSGTGNLFGAGAQQPLDPSKWPDEFGDLFMVGHPADQDDARVGWIQPAVPAEGTGNTAFFDPTNPREFKEPFGSEDGKNTPAKLREERMRSGWAGNPLEWDPVKKKLDGRKDNKLRYHAITAVEPFRNASFEELRLQDYMQNRRAPTQQKPQEKIMAYNQFSADPPVPMGAATPFGASAGGGGFSFGAKPATGFGSTPAFGASTTTPAFGSGSTMFGGGSTNTGFGSTSTFGQPATNAFGSSTTAFGATSAAPSNPFGASTSSAPAFGGFGATSQPAQTSTFGQPATGSTMFGSAPAAGTSTPFSFGGAAQKPAGTTFSFGQTAATSAAPSTFGSTPAAPFSFGSTSQPAQSNPFGAPAAANSNPFGAPAPAANPFGASAPTFGQPANNAAKPFSFGAPATSATPSFSLNTSAAPSQPFSFGANANQPKPFGGFGGSTTSSAPFSFGQTSTAGGLGLGGGLGASTAPFGGFGSTLGQPQQQQPSLQASIDQNAYGQAQSALFNMPAATSAAPAAPFAVQEKAKPPLTLPPRGTPRTATHALNRLRGISTPTSTSSAGASLSFTSPASSKGSPLSSLPSLGDGTSPVISPRAFVGRNSVKKLVIEPRKTSSPSTNGKAPSRLQFDPDAEVAASQGTPVRQITAGPTTTPAANADKSTSQVRVLNGSTGTGRSPGQAPYVLSPPLEELRQMSPNELQHVENFRVSRAGLGEIAWDDPVDLSTIDSLDRIAGSIVSIVPRKASVYAVEDFGNNKPPAGVGLNTPARVTLHDIWPIDLATRQPIKERGINEDLDARIDEFQRKLTGYNSKRPTVTKAMYDFPNGSWIFHVQHFSGYGLDDDGELIDAKDGGEMEVEEPITSTPKPRQARPVEEDDMETEHDDEMDDESYDDQGPPPPEASSSDGEQYLSEEGDYEEARRQERSLTPDVDAFREESPSPHPSSPAKASSAARLPWLTGSEPGREQLMSQTLFSANKSSALKKRQSTMRFVLPAADEQMDPDTPLPEPKERQAHVYERVSASDSIASGSEGNILDAGLTMGRSFRVSFGPDGELVRPLRLGKGESIRRERPLAACFSRESPVDDLLEVQLSRTVIQPGSGAADAASEQAPKALTQPTLRFRDFASSDSDAVQSSHVKLASALFDDLDLQLPAEVDEQTQVRAAELLRQCALSEWLEGDVKQSADEDARSAADAGARIFARLSGHQVEAACETAVDSLNLRLATLVAQAGTGDLSVRRDIALQLDRWREQRADAHIDVNLRKVYEVLAGNVGDSEGVRSGDKSDQSQTIFIAAGLDWKRAFGLHLWYAAPSPSLHLAFASFQTALETDGRVSRPIPTWARNGQTAAPAGIDDASFELLKLAAVDYPLEAALASQGFAASALDVRLPWHFAVTLTHGIRARSYQDAELSYETLADTATAPSATADGLTAAFAMQLEVLGSWAWAVFVLMHLSTGESRARGIKEVLARNVHQLEDKAATTFLVETLAAPAEWLYEAQALRAHYHGDLWQEMTLRNKARDYHGAHRICVNALAPEAVLINDLELLQQLFLPLEEFEIAGWQDGGGLFLDYVACLGDDGQGSQIRQLAPRLLAALPNLVSIRGRNDLRARAAYSTMLARISKLASAVDTGLRMLESVDASSLTPSDRLAYLADLTGKAFAANLAAACA